MWQVIGGNKLKKVRWRGSGGKNLQLGSFSLWQAMT
jgi:hypothetical protein